MGKSKYTGSEIQISWVRLKINKRVGVAGTEQIRGREGYRSKKQVRAGAHSLH